MTLYKKQSKTSASEAFLASLNADQGSKSNPFLTEKVYTALVAALDALDARQEPVILAIAIDGSIAWNVRANYNSEITLTGSSTLVLTDLLPGDYGTIKIIQGGTGSYTLTLPVGSVVGNTGAGALGLTAAVGSEDIATFYYDGTKLNWTMTPDFT